jgi:hypothetical protein
LGILLIAVCHKKWIRNGKIVSKGKEVYEIGDYYEYDESFDGEYTDLVDVKWKVMGVDNSGNLLIISSSNIGDLTLGDEDNFVDSLDDYLEAEKKFMLDCFYNHIRWNWYNCTKVMVILDE